MCVTPIPPIPNQDTWQLVWKCVSSVPLVYQIYAFVHSISLLMRNKDGCLSALPSSKLEETSFREIRPSIWLLLLERPQGSVFGDIASFWSQMYYHKSIIVPSGRPIKHFTTSLLVGTRCATVKGRRKGSETSPPFNKLQSTLQMPGPCIVSPSLHINKEHVINRFLLLHIACSSCYLGLTGKRLFCVRTRLKVKLLNTIIIQQYVSISIFL